jgi:hypothetical protein
MIELTTGVVFLMSSLYGSGQADTHMTNIITAESPTTQIASIVASIETPSTFTNDTKGMEAYLRNAYADTPILVDIARCESNFKQFDENGNVVRGRIDKADIGVMQINERYQGETAKKLGLDLYTVLGNVAYAKHLYEEQGSQPWSASAKCWSGDLARNK